MTLEYPRAIRKVIDRIEQTQMPAVGKAADLVVHALSNRGVVYCHNIGHGIEGDWIHRAGGLAAVQKFTYALNVQAPVPECLKDRPRGEPFDAIRESARYALRAGNIRAGDVMVLSSVSGRNIEPVQLALTCRELGVFTIALTSMDYTARVNSLHPSGKRLFEAADVALDCAQVLSPTWLTSEARGPSTLNLATGSSRSCPTAPSSMAAELAMPRPLPRRPPLSWITLLRARSLVKP